jgi:hypothetical protein
MADERRDAPDPEATAAAADGAVANPEPSLAEGGHTACDELIEAATADPSAPFAPDIVCQLAALKRANRAQFETLRTRLKRAGCRVTELDGVIDKESGAARSRSPNQADILITLAEAAELFQAPDETAYADIEVSEHRETWPVKSRGFRRWLRRRFFEEAGGAPNSEMLTAAIGVIEAKAQHDTPVREVFVRVGELDGRRCATTARRGGSDVGNRLEAALLHNR